MRFEHLARKLYSEPWMIYPIHHQTLATVFKSHLDNFKVDMLDDLMPEQPAAYTTPEGVRVIPVKGVISREISDMEKACGACDLMDVRAEIAMAIQSPDVVGIVLEINSPGGTVNGVQETAAEIKAARAIKPIIAQVSGMACSAAYWLAASASAIYAEPSATLGSVGVYMALLDRTRALEMAGLKMELIKSEASPLKAAGLTGVPLSEEQRANLQAGVDYLYSVFSGDVSASRKKMQPEAMRGQTYFGAQGIENGAVDSLATLQTAIKDVERLGRRSKV